MFILSNLINAVAQVLNMVIGIMTVLIFLRAIISWVSPDPYNPIVQLLYRMTDPLLSPIRRIIPFALMGGIDISPIIAFLFLIFLRHFVVQSLFDLGYWLKR